MIADSQVFVPDLDLVQGAGQSLRLRLRWLPSALRVTALLAISLGLLDLGVEHRQQTAITTGLDVVLVIDASRSMLAQDLEPDRLNAAKRLAEEFVKRRTHDRFAAISFAGDAVLECPLTADRSAVTQSIRAISAADRPDGTALGAAIANAVGRLRVTPAKGRVVVILTDGGSNAGNPAPEKAAALAEAYGVRLYPMGIGATRKVPYPTEFGTLSVALDLEETVLRGLADRTLGRYFRATDNGSLDVAFGELDLLEPTEYLAPGGLRRVSLTPLFALIALLSVLVEEILTTTYLRTVTS